MIASEELIAIAREAGTAEAAVLDVEAIEFHESFRKACEQNVCRKYDTNWMGPPAVGPIAELKERVMRYRSGLLFQTTHDVKSNFDMKGMLEGGKVHAAVFRDLVARIRARYTGEDILPLNAGCCTVCEKCAYLDRQPCRHPEEAFSSVEAYGMNVIALQKKADIPYYYGKTTVCYVGLILYR